MEVSGLTFLYIFNKFDNRGASKQLESHDNGGVDTSQPHVYYFVWGLFMSLTIMATTVASALAPWSIVKRISLLAVRLPPR
jgi:hypothetical protein